MTNKETEKKVLDLLKKKKEKYSPKQLAETIGVPILQIHKAVKTLYDGGEITLVDVDGQKMYEFSEIPASVTGSEKPSTENTDSTTKEDDKKVAKKHVKPVGRDTKKYKYKGVEYPKGRFVLEVVREYVNKKKPTLEKLQKVFPAEIVQKYGVFSVKKEAVKMSEAYPRFFLNAEDVLKTSDNQSICVTNQWTSERLSLFIGACLKANIELEK